MTTIDIDEVQGWAVAAGDLAKQYFNRATSWRKADHSYVTEADEAIERQLVGQISARYPEHGILGEEHANTHLDREFVWAIDPIDGTASFVAGLGNWCISIGLLRFGKPYFGVIYVPMLNDMYVGLVGQGSTLNGNPMHGIDPASWEGEHWLATPANLHRTFELEFRGKTRVLGSTAAQMCYVARGSALGALIVDAKPWDVAASLVIASEAGVVTVPLDPTLPISENILDAPWLQRPMIVAHPHQVEKLRKAFTSRR